jgi:raffinose/stachyose/melibiose transport system permease protein
MVATRKKIEWCDAYVQQTMANRQGLIATPMAAPTQAAAWPRTRARRGSREQRLVGFVYVSPAFLLYGLLVLVPFVYALYLSFYSWDGVGPRSYVGFANYKAIWEEPQLLWSFIHAAVLIAFFALLPIAVALLLTAVMTRSRVRGLTTFRTLLFLPQVMAPVAIAVVWEWILGPDGPLNGLLKDVGAGSLATPWLGSFTWALPAVGVIGSWVGYGFAMVLFMSGVEKIPSSLYDAARVDGAGPVSEFFAVTLPGLRNEITVMSVLAVTGALTSFDVIYVITSGGPGTSTQVPAYQLYTLAFTDFRVGTAAAMGVVLGVLVFVLALVILRLGRGEE